MVGCLFTSLGNNGLWGAWLAKNKKKSDNAPDITAASRFLEKFLFPVELRLQTDKGQNSGLHYFDLYQSGGGAQLVDLIQLGYWCRDRLLNDDAGV